MAVTPLTDAQRDRLADEVPELRKYLRTSERGREAVRVLGFDEAWSVTLYAATCAMRSWDETRPIGPYLAAAATRHLGTAILASLGGGCPEAEAVAGGGDCDTRLDADAMLASLPAAYRRAVAGWMAGRTLKDMAAEEGVTGEAIRQRRDKGLEMLRRRHNTTEDTTHVGS